MTKIILLNVIAIPNIFLNAGEDCVKLLNLILQNGVRNDFNEVLKSPDLGLREKIDDFALPLYYEEMKIDRIESQVKIEYVRYKIM